VTRLQEDAANAESRARELAHQITEALEESQAAVVARDTLAARLAESERLMRVATAKRDEAVSG